MATYYLHILPRAPRRSLMLWCGLAHLTIRGRSKPCYCGFGKNLRKPQHVRAHKKNRTRKLHARWAATLSCQKCIANQLVIQLSTLLRVRILHACVLGIRPPETVDHWTLLLQAPPSDPGAFLLEPCLGQYGTYSVNAAWKRGKEGPDIRILSASEPRNSTRSTAIFGSTAALPQQISSLARTLRNHMLACGSDSHAQR